MPDRILPPLRRTSADAEAFARAVHDGQVDKAGEPYVGHLSRVRYKAEQMALALTVSPRGTPALTRDDVDAVCQIALLHDVIEDTDHTPTDLAREGFHQGVIFDVLALTRVEGIGRTYQGWIEELCESARLPVLLVKLADIEDNADPARLAKLDEATRARLERKYGPARERLREAIRERRREHG